MTKIDFSKLKRNDILIINEEKYQVINNTSDWYFTETKKLRMVVEMIKVGKSQIEPNFF